MYDQWQAKVENLPAFLTHSTHTDDGDPTVSKTLIDHFSTNMWNQILYVDTIETEMVYYYMIYSIRKVNISRLNSSKT